MYTRTTSGVLKTFPRDHIRAPYLQRGQKLSVEECIHPHELLSINSIGLIQNYSYFIIISPQHIYGGLKLVADIELVGVEK